MAEPELPRADLRILQANERTLLAWIRTSLALMAFGFVLARIASWLRVHPEEGEPWSPWLGAALLALGALTNVVAAVRYERVRAAILAGRPIVPGRAAIIGLAAALAALGAVLAARVLIY